MNILMVGPSRNARGGMTTVVNNYFKSDLVKKIQLRYISTTIDGNILLRLIYAFSAYIRILICLIIQEIDIVHIHMASRGSFYRKSLIIMLSKRLNKKIIIHLHGAEFGIFYEKECSTREKKYVKDIFEQVDKVIVLSTEWESKLKEWFNCNLEVINNSIFLSEKNLYNTSSKNIVMLGRLNHRKGTYDLLKVIKLMLSELKEIRFVLAGDGDLVNLKNEIKNLDIGSYVNVLGWIDSKQREQLLNDTLIYVLPSYNEGMPMSVLEAMGHGIPTISTNVGGIPGIINSGIDGYLIQPGNVDELKEKIELLINDELLRDEISSNSYVKVKRKFSMDFHIEKLLNVYHSLMN